jgi:hypothetical protein
MTDRFAWHSLRALGNSRLVQLSALMPIIGYLIIFSSSFSEFTSLQIASFGEGTVWQRLDKLKLYFLYFGFSAIGLASVIYTIYCDEIIKNFGYAESYCSAMKDNATVDDIKRITNSDDVDFYTNMPHELNKYIKQIYYDFNTANPIARTACAALYALGFGLLAVPTLITFIRVSRALLLTLQA